MVGDCSHHTTAEGSDADPEAEAETVLLAAAFYSSGQQQTGLLRSFADELAASGWRVGGIVQELLLDADGRTRGVDAVALDTGEHIALNRPTESDRINHNCSLDVAALAEASGAAARAIRDGVDVVIIEKFGEQEQRGEGLSQDILHAVSEGIPTLVAVPDGVRDKWLAFSGGLGEDLSYGPGSFHDWWARVKPAAHIPTNTPHQR